MAWAWAVNGFFSVIGSVLTTILSMTFGFRTVQLGALATYAVAVVVVRQAGSGGAAAVAAAAADRGPLPATEPEPTPV